MSDPRITSGELKCVTKDMRMAYSHVEKRVIKVRENDKRIDRGECIILSSLETSRVVTNEGKHIVCWKQDPRYISGEYKVVKMQKVEVYDSRVKRKRVVKIDNKKIKTGEYIILSYVVSNSKAPKRWYNNGKIQLILNEDSVYEGWAPGKIM